MKRNKMIISVIAMLVILVLGGCGNQDELNRLQGENQSLSSENQSLSSENQTINSENQTLNSEKQEMEVKISDLQAEVEKLNSDLAKSRNDLEKIQKEYNAYKLKMSEYEDLAEAEVESRKIEAERIKAEEEEKRKKEAEQAKKEAEEKEKKGYDTGITYDQLARTPDDYKGEKVKFKGKVVQVLEGDSTIDLRLAVNSDYDKMVYLYYPKKLVSSRVLEDDKITIYGVSEGLYTYKSTMGGHITIPIIRVDKIDQ